MVDRKSTIERAAAALHQQTSQATVERAAKILTGAQSALREEIVGGKSYHEVTSERDERGRQEPLPEPARLSRLVSIDKDRLQRKGFITPGNDPTRLTEEFRLLKQQVLRRAFANSVGNGTKANLVMVTSAKPREGKTFTAINLSLSIAAEMDTHVLLIDADLMRPSILINLGLREDKGLVDLLLQDDLDPADVILRTDVGKLSLIPAGKHSSMSTELLASDRMIALSNELAQRYPDRVIVFDSPPLLATSEPSVLAHQVGQILVIVEAEQTSEAALQAAMRLVADCKNVAIVLNKAKPMLGAPYFGRYYAYYGKGRK